LPRAIYHPGLGPQNPGRAENLCFSPYSKTPEHHPKGREKKRGKQGKQTLSYLKSPKAKCKK
jgi:hypothetical protein